MDKERDARNKAWQFKENNVLMNEAADDTVKSISFRFQTGISYFYLEFSWGESDYVYEQC